MSFSTTKDDESMINNLIFFNEQLRKDNLELRRKIYQLTHKTPYWKQLIAKMIVRIMRA